MALRDRAHEEGADGEHAAEDPSEEAHDPAAERVGAVSWRAVLHPVTVTIPVKPVTRSRATAVHT